MSNDWTHKQHHSGENASIAEPLLAKISHSNSKG